MRIVRVLALVLFAAAILGIHLSSPDGLGNNFLTWFGIGSAGLVCAMLFFIDRLGERKALAREQFTARFHAMDKRGQRNQLLVLAALFVLIAAASFWLDGILYSRFG